MRNTTNHPPLFLTIPIPRSRLYRSVSTQDGVDFASISEAELRQTVDYERQLVLDARAAYASGRPEGESTAAATLIGRVKSTARHVWGTDYERGKQLLLLLVGSRHAYSHACGQIVTVRRFGRCPITSALQPIF